MEDFTAVQVQTVLVEDQIAYREFINEVREYTVWSMDTETVGHSSTRHWQQEIVYREPIPTMQLRLDRLKYIYKKRYKQRHIGLRAQIADLKKELKSLISSANKEAKAALRSKDGLRFWLNKLGCVQVGIETAPGSYKAFLIRPHLVNSEEFQTLANSRERILFHSAQFDWKMLKFHLGVTLDGSLLWDVKIVEYMLNNGKTIGQNSLGQIARRRLGIEMVKDKQIRVSDWLGVWSSEQCDYAGADIVSLFPIAVSQEAEWSELPYDQRQGMNHRRRIEMEMIPVTATMEMNGLGINIDAVKELLESEVRAREEAIRALAGLFNQPVDFQPEAFTRSLNSPVALKRHLASVGIFVDSTNEKTLNRLKHEPVIQALFTYRKHQKLISTYLEPFISQAVVHPDGGMRIYGEFTQNGPETGRLSASKPNLQNLEATYRYRRSFVSRPGFVFVNGDLSQIELRVLGEYSGEPALLSAFYDGVDCHTRAASFVFGVPYDQVSKSQRGNVKHIQFGIIYGLTPYGLALRLGVGELTARVLIKQYFQVYRRVEEWIEEVKAKAREDGYVQTLGGLVRYLPHINDPDEKLRARAERQAVNTLIQGSSADMMKYSLLMLYHKIEAWNYNNPDKPIYLIATVHDEILVEAHVEAAVVARKMVQETLIDGCKQYVKRVPIQVGDAESGWQPIMMLEWGVAKLEPDEKELTSYSSLEIYRKKLDDVAA